MCPLKHIDLNVLPHKFDLNVPLKYLWLQLNWKENKEKLWKGMKTKKKDEKQ